VQLERDIDMNAEKRIKKLKDKEVNFQDRQKLKWPDWWEKEKSSTEESFKEKYLGEFDAQYESGKEDKSNWKHGMK